MPNYEQTDLKTAIVINDIDSEKRFVNLFGEFSPLCVICNSFWFDSVKGRRATWNQMSTLAKNSISKLHDQYGDTAN